MDEVYAKRQAEQMEIQAGQEVATATFNSQRIAQRVKEIMSEQQLAASAGGGDTTGGTVSAIRSETVRNGSLAQMLELAQAEDRANQLRYDANATRKSGAYARKLGNDRALGTLIGTASTVIKGIEAFGSQAGGTKPPGPA